jgi:hypothetical protein
VLAFLACSPYSYSDVVYGSSNTTAYNWVMQNILPQQMGLTVGSVIYRYTTEKETSDAMLVHVQNKNALGDGYIFRSTDDWSGLPGNTINKVVAVGDVPIDYWGAGSIVVEGTGTVIDPSVIYTYRYDTCFDPQTDPSCEGYQTPYVAPIFVEFVDPLDEEAIRLEMEREVAEIEEEEEAERIRRRLRIADKLELMLGGINGAMMDSVALAQEQALFGMKFIPKSYLTSLAGGEYVDALQFEHKEIPKNMKALRNGFAQQLLHEKMVKAQYDNILSKSAK